MKHLDHRRREAGDVEDEELDAALAAGNAALLTHVQANSSHVDTLNALLAQRPSSRPGPRRAADAPASGIDRRRLARTLAEALSRARADSGDLARALTQGRIRNRDPDLDQALARNLALTLTQVHDLLRALELPLSATGGLEVDLAYDFAHALVRVLDPDLDRFIAWDLPEVSCSLLWDFPDTDRSVAQDLVDLLTHARAQGDARRLDLDNARAHARALLGTRSVVSAYVHARNLATVLVGSLDHLLQRLGAFTEDFWCGLAEGAVGGAGADRAGYD